jgi:hypothetical protein
MDGELLSEEFKSSSLRVSILWKSVFTSNLLYLGKSDCVLDSRSYLLFSPGDLSDFFESFELILRISFYYL